MREGSDILSPLFLPTDSTTDHPSKNRREGGKYSLSSLHGGEWGRFGSLPHGRFNKSF